MRIMIFGNPASGKSTFANKLSEELNIPVIHLDINMDKIGRKNREEIKQFIKEQSSKESWIIEGNSFTKDKHGIRIKRADHIFIFNTNRFITFFNLMKRHIRITYKMEERKGSENPALNLKYFIPYIFFKFPKRRNAQTKIAEALEKNITFISNYNEIDKILIDFNLNNS